MENSSNSTFDDSADVGTYVFSFLVHIILFLFGVPGNCLILRVYRTKTRKTSTHVLITALAWADLVVCLLVVSPISERALLLAGVSEKIRETYKFLWPFETAAIGTSIFITAFIAVDRYDCTCRPHRRFFSCRRAKMATWAAVLIASVTSIPSLLRATDLSDPVFSTLEFAFQAASFVGAFVIIAFCYGQVYRTIRKRVKIGAAPRRSWRREDGLRLDSKWATQQQLTNAAADGGADISVVTNAVSTFVHQPSSSSTMQTYSCKVNTKMGGSSTLHTQVMPALPTDKHTKKCVSQETRPVVRIDASAGADPRAKMKSKHPLHEPENGARCTLQRAGATDVQRKTTRMLFITSVVFLLTWLPYWIWVVVRLCSYGGANIAPEFWKISSELFVAMYINNAVNPLIYGLANRRFRKDCREVLRRIRLR